MFASNALTLPTPFGHEHRPLRLTSESSRPQPHGACHHRAQTSSAQNHQCTCQSYQHDRRAPGNVCDCGHPACYHSPSSDGEGRSPDRIITALADKIKKLEEYIARERQIRRDELFRERQLWEREVRVLREAVSPFYQNEKDMRRKLMDLEDKIDTYYDEQHRLGERVSATDHANMNLERRVQIWEDTRGRKRKASITVEGAGVMSPESNYTSASSIESDTASSSANISPQPASPVNPPLQGGIAIPSPRSSGVLNYRATSRHNSRDHDHNRRQPQMTNANGEPRSSGFLSIDLAQRVGKYSSSARPEERLLPVRSIPVGDPRGRSPSVSSRLPTPPQGKAPTGALTVSGLLSHSPTRPGSDLRAAKKRKQQNGTMALDVLANASVARPLAHCS